MAKVRKTGRVKPHRNGGFICPKCHLPTRVTRTRVIAEQIMRRIRECPGCDYMLATEERPRRVDSVGGGI